MEAGPDAVMEVRAAQVRLARERDKVQALAVEAPVAVDGSLAMRDRGRFRRPPGAHNSHNNTSSRSPRHHGR